MRTSIEGVHPLVVLKKTANKHCSKFKILNPAGMENRLQQGRGYSPTLLYGMMCRVLRYRGAVHKGRHVGGGRGGFGSA